MISHDTVLDFYENSHEDYKAGLEAVYNNTKKIIFSIGGVRVRGISITNVNKIINPNKRNNFLLTIAFNTKYYGNTEATGKKKRVRMNQNVDFDSLTDVLLSIFSGIIKGNPTIYPSKPLPEFKYVTKVILFLFVLNF